MNEQTIINDLLDEVSEEELSDLDAILLKLGLKDDPKTLPPKTKRKGELTTYNLKVLFNCSLCGGSYSSVFVMEASSDGTQRIGKEFKENEDIYCHKTRIENVHFCSKCKVFLESKTKEELVTIILRMVKCI